jgi:hypothetical protein
MTNIRSNLFNIRDIRSNLFYAKKMEEN